AMVSAGVSHGSSLGCCLKSVSTWPTGSQAAAKASGNNTRLRFMPHLHRAVLPEQFSGFFRAFSGCLHEDSEVALTEAFVVSDRHGQARDAREREQREDRGQR